MSNINTFNVITYGSTSENKPMLLNMDYFSQVRDNGNSTTLIMYSTSLGVDNYIPIVVSESFSSVVAKQEAKTSSGTALLYVKLLNKVVTNKAFNLDSKYFVYAKQDTNPNDTILVYLANEGNSYDTYVVQGTLSGILSLIIAPTFPQFSITFERSITTDPQTITSPTPVPGTSYKIQTSFVNPGGNGVNSISIIDESSFDISVVTIPTDVTFTLTYP